MARTASIRDRRSTPVSTSAINGSDTRPTRCRRSRALLDRWDCPAGCRGVLGSDRFGYFISAIPQDIPANHFSDKTNPKSRVGRHPFVVAHEGNAEALTKPNAPHQPHGLESADEPSADVRVEEGCLVGTDDDIRLVEKVKGTSGTNSLNGADHRLPHLLPFRAQELARITVVPDIFWLPIVRMDIEAGTEGAIARRPQDDRVDAWIGLDAMPGMPHFLAHLTVECVEVVGTVERQNRQPVRRTGLVPNRLVIGRELRGRHRCHCGAASCSCVESIFLVMVAAVLRTARSRG
jgi:hypothetical protein